MDKDIITDIAKTIAVASIVVSGALYLENRMDNFVTKNELKEMRVDARINFNKWVIEVLGIEVRLYEDKILEGKELTSEQKKLLARSRNMIELHKKDTEYVLKFERFESIGK